MRPLSYTESFEIDLPPDVLWEPLSNVDRVNQLAGFPPVVYEYALDEKGQTLVFGNAKLGPIKMRWQEFTARWTEGEYYVLNRRFENGPMRTLRSRMDLKPGAMPNTTVVTHQLDILPRGSFGYFFVKAVVLKKIAAGFQRAYGVAKEWVEEQMVPQAGLAKSRATNKHAILLRQRLSRAAQGTRPELIKALNRHLLNTVDDELSTLRPFRLARTWNANRDEVLKLFLNATKDGVFDLRWELLCPSCRRGNAHYSSLRDLPAGGHCTACNIDYRADFDRSVEVTFSPQPLGLGDDSAEYCFASPQNTPHRLTSWVLPPNEVSEHQIQLEPGTYEVLIPGVGGGVFF